MHLTNSEKNLPTAVNRRYHRSVNGNDGKRETFGSLSVHLTQNGQCKITLGFAYKRFKPLNVNNMC